MHVSYGAPLVQWIGEYAGLADNPYFHHAHRVFVESRYIFPDDQKFLPVGSLKLDNYLHFGRSAKTFETFSVAWKPRWTLGVDSSFARYLESVCSLAKNHGVTVNFVIHPMLLSSLKRVGDERSLMTLSEMRDCEKFRFVTGADFLDDVLGSSIFVGDVSSTLAEFVSTRRPIIFTGETGSLNALGRLIVPACYSVKTPIDLVERVLGIMSGDDELRGERTGLFEEAFVHDMRQSAAARVRDYLVQEASTQ
jgi:hypothetical protein